MQKECVQEAPTVEEAVDAALEELGVQQDAVEYEVLEEGGKRVFGIGQSKPARVRVWVKPEYLKEMEGAREAAREVLDEGEADTDEPQDAAPQRESEPEEIDDDELDRIADAAVGAIKEILESFGIEGTVEEYEGDDGEIILDIVGPDLAVLIGRHGRTLDSLQTIVSAVTNRAVGYRYPVIVDVEGYRNRRREKLEQMAQRSADRAVRQRGPVRLRPMNAYERRIVHVALRDDRRVETMSEGEDPNRQVVVRPR